MGRGVALDRLPEATAVRVRTLLAEARDLAGLTNGDLAHFLKCEKRQVSNAFAAGRCLRPKMVRDLILVINHGDQLKPPPRTDSLKAVPARRRRTLSVGQLTAQAALALTSPSAAAVPPVLIPPQAVKPLAQYLAKEMEGKSGFGTKRRSTVERELEQCLNRTRADLGFSAVSYYWARLGQEYDAAEAEKRESELASIFGIGQKAIPDYGGKRAQMDAEARHERGKALLNSLKARAKATSTKRRRRP